jgi:hypothetical protein
MHLGTCVVTNELTNDGGKIGTIFLSDDPQSHVGNEIEDQKDDFEQPKKRVNDHVERVSGNREPFALRTAH